MLARITEIMAEHLPGEMELKSYPDQPCHPSADNRADLLTKALDGDAFRRHRAAVLDMRE